MLASALAAAPHVVSGSAGQSKLLGFLPATPPAWMVYLTVAATFTHLLARFTVFVIARHDRKQDRATKIKQGYWIDRLIVPVCIDPLVGFCTEFSQRVGTLSGVAAKADAAIRNGLLKEFLFDFKREKQNLAIRFGLLGHINPTIYRTVMSLLDDLEDDIALFCAVTSFGSEALEGNEKAPENPEDAILYTLTAIFGEVFPHRKEIV